MQSQDPSEGFFTKIGNSIKSTMNDLANWAEEKLSFTLQVDAAKGVGVTGSVNFDTKGVNLCGGYAHGKGIAGTATLDYYNGPEPQGFTSITTVAGGDTYGAYTSMVVTNGGIGYGGGIGAGVGLYIGTNPVYCTGRIPYTEMVDRLKRF